MNAHVERYLKERMWMHQARAWLSANDERIVASAMYHLNHLARHVFGEKREQIYLAKNRLIEEFYKRGFCERVTVEVQTFECWDCDGTGVDQYAWGDDDSNCYKCGGTGIYRQHTLYRFVFNVHGRWFVWHQPADLVTWDVQTDGNMSEFEKGHLPPQDIEQHRVAHLYIRLVCAYLRRCGVPANELPRPYGLRQLARDYWHDTRIARHWHLYWRPLLRQRLNNAHRLFHFINTGSWEQPEDYIPF
jgi:hypothetical protein